MQNSKPDVSTPWRVNMRPACERSVAFREIPDRMPAGFTLIELMVVIGIISVLLAMLMPALAASRIAAQRLVSSSNLRQIGIALTMHRQDHNNHLPIQTQAIGHAADGPGMKALYDQGYIKTSRVAWAPLDRLNPVPTGIYHNQQNVDNSAQVSYLYMYYMYYNPGSGRFYADDIRRASEASIVEELYGGSRFPSKYSNNTKGDGGYILFMDGHVEWKKPPWNLPGWANCYQLPTWPLQ